MDMEQNDVSDYVAHPDSWLCQVDEDGVLTLPDELWETLGWELGDELEFVPGEDGSFFIKKVDETLTAD